MRREARLEPLTGISITNNFEVPATVIVTGNFFTQILTKHNNQLWGLPPQSTVEQMITLLELSMCAQKKKESMVFYLILQILRRRYIDTMERARVRANQRKRSQIEQNNSFLQNVGWIEILNIIERKYWVYAL